MSIDLADVFKRFFPMRHPTLGIIAYPKRFIDVGIGGGDEAAQLKALWPAMEVIGLEPSEEMRDKSAADKYPGILLEHGAWSHARKIRLSNDLQQSSVFTCHPFSTHGDGNTRFWTEIEVRPLDELIKRYTLIAPGIFLWLDIEGAELEALRGAWRMLQSHVCIINAEVRAKPLPGGACSEAEVDAFLAAFGFAKVLTYNRHGGDDPHHDAVYVRSCQERTW